MRGRSVAGAIAAGVLAVMIPVPFAPAPEAQAVTLPSGLQTGFQIDGNKTAGSPPDSFDWDDILTPPQPDGSFTFTPTAPYTTGSGATSGGVSQGAFYWDNGSLNDACSGSEPTGQPGSQNPDTNPWVPGPSSPNDKGNLCSGGYAVEAVTAPDGQRHHILYAYWTRRTDNAAVSVYELFEGPDAGRCDDLLLQAMFPAGTTQFLTWTPEAGDDCANPLGSGSWGAAGRTIDFAFAMGERTEGPTAGGQQGNTFAEYAIDLTAAGLFGEDSCATFTVSTRFSRTGTSPTATIQDFFLNTPDPLDISNCGTLTVTKEVTPPGSTDDEFGFTVSSDDGPIQPGPPPVPQIVDSVRPGETVTYTDVRSGAQTHLDETGIPQPWLKQSVVCSYVDSAGQPQTVDVTDPTTPFPILDDGRTDCVITNNAALVTLTKQVEPDGAPGTFTFDFGGTEVSLADGESRTIAFPDGAEVTMTEEPMEGWSAPQISCTGDATTTEQSATVTAQLGENIECTFTNTQLGTVIITKEAHGIDGRTFEFVGTFPGSEDGFNVTVPQGDGTLVDTTFPNIPPGEYSITELLDTEDPPMVVSDVSCTFGGADHSFPPEERTGRFTVLPGETVRCFFTNSLPNQIFVIKRTLPVEFDNQFTFTVDPPVVTSPFVLNGNSDGPPAGALWSSPPLEPDTYTITEAFQPNWTLVDITCTADEDVWEPDLAAGQVTIDLPPNETVTCFFTNQAAPAQATVTKTVDGVADGLPWEFDVAISPDTDVTPDPAQRLAGTGPGTDSVTWEDLVPGQQYTISETQQAGWDMGPMTCTDPEDPDLADLDSEPLTFTFVAQIGQRLDCAMTNTGLPSQLRLTKITSGIGFDYPWDFDFTINPVPDGEVELKSVDGVGQTSDVISWDNLVPGQTYTMTELGELEGITVSVDCGPGPAPREETFEFTAPLGGDVACTVTNLANPVTMQITKTTEGGDGSFSYVLDTVGDTGQDPQVLPIVTSGGTGTGSFVTLVPGQHYSLTEMEDPAWQQAGLPCTVTPLEGEPFEIPDLSDFTVDTGDAVDCSATNVLLGNSVSVTKVVEGVADGFEWSFEISLTPEAGEALTEVASGTGNTSAQVSWTGLEPGTYALSEVVPDGWNAPAIECVEGEVAVAPDALVIEPGRAYTCTITNSPQPAQLTITKTVEGVADGFEWAFVFTLDPGADPSASQTVTGTGPGSGDVSWSGLVPGTMYTLSEDIPAGWSAEDITCTGPADADPDTPGWQFTPETGQQIACTATNQADVSPPGPPEPPPTEPTEPGEPGEPGELGEPGEPGELLPLVPEQMLPRSGRDLAGVVGYALVLLVLGAALVGYSRARFDAARG
jgi:prealbumin domain-containing protein